MELETAIKYANTQIKNKDWAPEYLQYHSVKRDLKSVKDCLQHIRQKRLVFNAFYFSFALKEIMKDGEEGREDRRELEEFSEEKKEVIREFEKVWQHMRQRGIPLNEVVENQFISIFSRMGETEKAQEKLKELMKEGGKLSSYSFVPIITHLILIKGDFDNAEKVWKMMEKEGINPDIKVLYAIVSALARQRDMKRVEETFELMKRRNVPWDFRLFNAVCIEVAKNGEIEELMKWIEKMKGVGLQPDHSIIDPAVFGWLTRKDENTLKKTEELIERANTKLGRLGYQSIIKHLLSKDQFEEAERWYERMSEDKIVVDPPFFTVLLETLAERKNEEEIKKWMGKMEKCGIRSNHIHFRAMIEVLLKGGSEEMANRLKGEMEKEGIPADEVVYRAFIAAAVKRKDEEKVLFWLKEMKEKRVKATSITQTTIAAMNVENKELEKMIGHLKKQEKYTMNTSAIRHANLADPKGAMEVVGKMKEKGVKPDAVTYTAVVVGHAKRGDFDSCRKVINQMVKEGVQPTISTFSAIIGEVMKSNEDLEWWLHEMERLEVKMDAKFINAILNSLVKKGKLEEVPKWIMKMKELGLKPDLITFNSFLVMLAKKRSETIKVKKWLDIMKQDGTKPDSSTYNSIMSAYYAMWDVEKAEYWKEEMIKDGIAPDIFTYGMWIKNAAEKKEVERVKSLLEEMEKNGIQPNVIIYNSILSSEGMGDISYWMEEMKRRGFQPSVVTYTILMGKCAKVQDVKGMMEWYEVILKEEIKPTEFTYSVLAEGFVNAGDIKTPDRILQKHAWSIAPFRVLLRAMAEQGSSSEEIHRYLKNLEAKGMEVDVNVLASIIYGYGKVNNMEMVQYWVDEIAKRGWKMTVSTYVPLVKASACAGDIAGVVHYLEAMRKDGVYFSPVVFQSFLDMLETSGPLEKFRDELEHVVFKLIPRYPDHVTAQLIARIGGVPQEKSHE